MKKTYLLVFLLAFLSITLNLSAQCTWESYKTADGLLDSSYNSIKFLNGKIIAGTSSSATQKGISVWNGSSWTNYKNDSLSASINDITTDKNGNYWLATGDGVHKFDGTNITVFRKSDGLADNWISSIHCDKVGRIWAGSSNGVSVYDGSKWTTFGASDTPNVICALYTSEIKTGPDGYTYVGSYNGCISVFDGLTAKKTMNLPTHELGSFDFDKNGDMWFFDTDYTNNKTDLLKYDGSTYTRYSNIPIFNGTSHVFYVKADQYGNIWFAYMDGIGVFDGKNWVKYTKDNGLIANYIGQIAIDGDGTFWYSSNHGIGALTQQVDISFRSVHASGSINAGYMKLYKMDEGVKAYVQKDSMGIDNQGFATFKSLGLGKYICIAHPDNTTFPDYVPTYYGDEDLWENASIISVTKCDSVYAELEINVIKKEAVTPGNGRINGYVKSKDGTRAESNPIKDVGVTLKKVSGSIVSNTKTNESGFYEFTKVPEGDYQVMVNLTGLDLKEIRKVTVSGTDTVHENEDFGVDSTGIYKDDFSSVLESSNLNGVSVFPNPAKDILNINIAIDELILIDIKLYDISGRTVYSNKSNTNQIKLDVSNFNNGIYLLEISNETQFYREKILIK